MNTIFGPRQVSARSGVLQQSLRDHSRVAYQAAIVAAAESVILKNEFKQTKVADIAEASGVSVGTLYNYFKSKEAVMQAIVSHRCEQLRTELEQPFDSPDPLDQLRQWVVRVHAYIEKNGELLRLHARTKVDPSAWLSQFPDFDATRPGLDARLDACARTGKLRTDIPAPQLAWALRAVFQSMLLEWNQHNVAFSLVQRGDSLLALLLEGSENRFVAPSLPCPQSHVTGCSRDGQAGFANSSPSHQASGL